MALILVYSEEIIAFYHSNRIEKYFGKLKCIYTKSTYSGRGDGILIMVDSEEIIALYLS